MPSRTVPRPNVRKSDLASFDRAALMIIGGLACGIWLYILTVAVRVFIWGALVKEVTR